MKRVQAYVKCKCKYDRYICFDQSGSIVKISRDADDALENLLVDFEEVRMFAEGKETLRDFKVEYDFLEKKYLSFYALCAGILFADQEK